MIKAILSGSFDFNDAAAQIVPLHKAGVDAGWTTKRAAAHVFDFSKFAANKNETLVHLLALGDGETVGCFPAGTEVRMGDAGLKEIENIRVGDKVVTHTNTVKPVAHLFERSYDGSMIELGVMGLLDSVTATPNHQLLVIRQQQTVCQVDKAKRCTPRTMQKNAMCSRRRCPRTSITYTPEWVRADKLEVGDFVLQAAPSGFVGKQSWEMTPSEAKLLGYFLAEGSFLKSKSSSELAGLSFSFGIQEEHTLAAHAVNLAREACPSGRVTGPRICDNKSTATVLLRHADYANQVRDYVGEYSHGKYIGGQIFNQPPSVQAAFIAGWIDGDGTQIEEDGRVTVTTVSRRLALDAQWLSLRQGIDFALCRYCDSNPKHRDRYQLSAHSRRFGEVAKFSAKVAPQGVKQSKAWGFFWNGFSCRPVRRIIRRPFSGTVYNFEVEEDHSYTVANGVVVKNCNRNGDYFPKAANAKYHPTFMRAGFFRNHDNKDIQKAAGRVVAAAHNEPMGRVELIIGIDNEKGASDLGVLEKDGEFPCSMSCRVPFDVCFPAATPVATLDGARAIETISPSDLVLTHAGVFREVVRTYIRKYSGAWVTLTLRGHLQNLSGTGSHPVLVYSRDSVLCRRRGGEYRHLLDVSDTCRVCSAVVTPSWKPLRNVATGDFVVAAPAAGFEDFCSSDAWLLGLYLGDGCLHKYSLSSGEKVARAVQFTTASRDAAILNKLADLGASSYSYGKKTYCQSLIADRNLVDLARSLVGEGALTKRLSYEILTWSTRARLAFLSGVIDADGSVVRAPGRGEIVITLANGGLIEDLALLARSCGVPVTVHHGVNNGYNAGSLAATLRIPASFAHLFSAESCKLAGVAPSRSKCHSLVTSEYVALRVEAADHEFVERRDVFNLEVEVDNSYVACGLVVHNCSICDNKAKSRAEYCKHAALAMGRIMEDGKQAYVINDHPDFFDLSRVWRGADRVAFTFRKLEKAAAEGGTLGGAELAELLEVVDGQLPVVRSIYSIAKAALAAKMAAVLGMPLPPLDEPELPRSALQLFKQADAGALFSLLHRDGCCLPLPAFLEVIRIEKPAHVSYNDIKRRVREIVASPSDPGLLRACQDGSYDGSTATLLSKTASAVYGIKNQFTLYSDTLLYKVASVGLPASSFEKCAGDVPPAAEPLAEAYTAYLLSFARSAGEGVNGEFVQNLTALRALG